MEKFCDVLLYNLDLRSYGQLLSLFSLIHIFFYSDRSSSYSDSFWSFLLLVIVDSNKFYIHQYLRAARFKTVYRIAIDREKN